MQDKIEAAIEAGPESAYTIDVDTAREIAHRWLKDAVWRRERAATRRIERKSFREMNDAKTKIDLRAGRMGARESAESAMERVMLIRYTDELLARKVVLGAREGNDTVSWGSMTLDQHNERAKALLSQASSLNETAGHHLRAAQDLENAGENTLYDLVKGLKNGAH